MKKIFLILLTSSICLTQACSQYGRSQFLYKDDNGIDIYQTRCKRDSADCYQSAGDTCPAGFKIIDWYGYDSYGPISVIKKRKDASETELVKNGGGKYMTGGGTMMFQCKGSSSR